ncbi:YSC84-related protein [Saliniradius amylolyticus]|nr:YSC84-related protein [Saliniradius amylolyticus]
MLKSLPLFTVLITVLLSGCVANQGATVAEKRQAVLVMKDTVLTRLFNEKPSTRAQLNAAPGYAVFSNANVNLFFMAAGGGYGVVKNMASGQHTYMKMAEGGVGLGLGVKDYRIVMVFHTKEAMHQFVESGWTFGGNADAAAKAGEQGGSVQGEAYYGNVTVYTLTESGLALQATIKGTKFWKDNELN